MTRSTVDLQALATAGPSADVPTYRYWGSSKPPKNADVLCRVDPKTSPDASKATLRLYGPIDPWGGFWGTSAKEVAQALDELGDGITEIQLRVNSPGGSVFEGLAILNLLRAHPAKVTAVVDGLAASAASYIVAGADERVMAPGTQMMIHDPWSSAWGCNAAEMTKVAGVLDKIAQGLADLYASIAGGTTEAWRALMVEETWYTASEAHTAGLVDRVAVVPNLGSASTAGDEPDAPELESTEPEDLVQMFDLAVFNHAGRPAAPQPPSASAVGSITTHERSSDVAFTTEQLITMRQDLGLSETADEATIVAALSEALAERADSGPSTPTVPEGMALIDTATLENLRTSAEQGRQAREQQMADRRESLVAAAVQDGRIAPARHEDWINMLAADPGAEQTLASLAPGLVPVAEMGHAGDESSTDLLAAVNDHALDAFAASLGLSKEDLRG